MRTYRFRLYPARRQEGQLQRTLDKCRRVYNFCLSELNAQDVHDKGMVKARIVDLKICEPELTEAYSKALQPECDKLFSNLSALSALKKKGRRVGRLRFKSRKVFKSFTYNQSGFKLIKTKNRLDLLHLSKIGSLPLRMHRTFAGIIKQITVKRYCSGKWYAFVCVEEDATLQEKTGNSIGIDLGLINLIYDSDGRKVEHPQHLKSSLKNLKKQQRWLSRKKKKSKNREKQRIKLARAYEQTVEQRDDFHHKLSRKYIDNYDFIVVEDLKVRNMIKNHCLAQSIQDASWSKLVRMMAYKAERAGKTLQKIDPKYTSQKCSRCEKIVKKTLAERVHHCPYCGLELDRDHNAALNILRIGQELSEYTPVETEPLLLREQVQSMKQEAHML